MGRAHTKRIVNGMKRAYRFMKKIFRKGSPYVKKGLPYVLYLAFAIYLYREGYQSMPDDRVKRLFTAFYSAGPVIDVINPDVIKKAFTTMGLSPESSAADLKKRYMALSRIHHPDKPEGSHEKMIEINAANDILKKYYEVTE